MRTKIDEILEFLALNNGRLQMDDVAKAIDAPHDVCTEILDFLAEYGFIKSRDGRLSVNKKMRDLVLSAWDKRSSLNAEITVAAASSSTSE